MANPERVTATVSQNGNAYEEGLGDAWGPIRKYWADAKFHCSTVGFVKRDIVASCEPH